MYIRTKEVALIINEWIEYLSIQRNYSHNTLESYSNDLNNFINFLTHYLEKDASLKLIESIDTRLIRSWLSKRHRDNYSVSSNARSLSTIRNFYNFLEKRHGIKSHIIFSIKIPKKPKPLPKSLSEDDIQIALDNIASLSDEEWIDIRNRALLTLIYSTGLRISEALSITKLDVSNNEFLRISGKGEKERILPWINDVKLLIEKYIKILPYRINIDDKIFLGKHGKPLQRSVFSKELIKLRRMLGLPEYLTSHSFRHSFATHLLENGADLRVIQELLGHKNLSTTQRYTKINKKHLESVYKKTHPTDL